jgi:riboflavin kinase/FMN adenylyltransferase
MRIFKSIEEIPAGFGPSVAVIGNFDGVHLGHQEILSAIVKEARATDARAVAVTFDPHPEQFLRPERAPLLLTLLPRRLELLAATGIDAVLVLHFDEALCKLSARVFAESILVKALGVRSIHEGANFRFGYCAEAGVAELAEFGRELGFGVTVHGAVQVRGHEVSSSAIRKSLREGDLRKARWMLGRSFAVCSTPARGRGIGTRLVVPTVNLAAYPGQLPALGVYVTRLRVGLGAGSKCFQSVTNVGNRPTFGADSFAVESHILDFEPVELSEETPLELEFLFRLRPEMTWPSPEALRAQIMRDVRRAKRYFQLSATGK